MNIPVIENVTMLINQILDQAIFLLDWNAVTLYILTSMTLNKVLHSN